MKRILKTIAATLVFIVTTGSISFAQSAALTYNDGMGTPNAGSYAPGTSFSFSIVLTFAPGGSVANLEGLSYWFEQQNPSAPFNFSITLRDVTGSSFTDLQTPGLTYPQSLNPQSADDLGALLPGSTGLGAGSYLIANLTINISPTAAPGIYLLENTTTFGKISVITDDAGNTFPISQALYSITVVPEPATWSLLALGGLGILARRPLRARTKN
jgi:hypothetical protein